MDIETYRNYCISKKLATESLPFPSLPNLLVFKIAGKMFSAADISFFEGFSVKCNPDTIDELKAKYPAIQNPPYFSERHWAKIILDKSIPDKQLFEWIDISYDLVVAKLTKKVRAELNL